MATQVILPNTNSMSNKKRPHLCTRRSAASRRRTHPRLGEVSGKVMADCTAVCCCCPLGVANVVFFVVYKVPAGLCQMAVKNTRRRRLVKKGVLPAPVSQGHQWLCEPPMMFVEEDESDSEAVMNLEKEMLERFGAGFWRSPSQKERGGPISV